MDERNPEMIKNYLSQVTDTLNKLPVAKITKVVEVLGEARDRGSRIFIFGNGGSAATASHFACDLAKGAICKGKPRFKAFALTDNVPLLSAWANDTDYSSVFAEQLENLVEHGDQVLRKWLKSNDVKKQMKALTMIPKYAALTGGDIQSLDPLVEKFMELLFKIELDHKSNPLLTLEKLLTDEEKFIEFLR